MWDDIQNLRTVDFKVREPLNGLAQSWVIGRVVSQNGVNGALWRGEEPLRLSVEYDADLLTGAELLDLLRMCGLHARPAALGARRR